MVASAPSSIARSRAASAIFSWNTSPVSVFTTTATLGLELFFVASPVPPAQANCIRNSAAKATTAPVRTLFLIPDIDSPPQNLS